MRHFYIVLLQIGIKAFFKYLYLYAYYVDITHIYHIILIGKVGYITMAKVSTNINLDVDLKKSCQELFSDLGMDLTTAVTIFLKQSLRCQGLPFSVNREVPNKETIEALKEYEVMKEHPENYKRYNNIRDAVKDVLEDV